MMRRVRNVGVAIVTLTLGLVSALSHQCGANEQRPIIQKGVVGIKLRERGALLVDGFQSDTMNKKTWRIWHSDPTAVQFSFSAGRFEIRGKNKLQHNGLWSLNPAKYKDVTLIGRMNVHSTGPEPHELLLHLCGGDFPRSPDHWVEIAMKHISERKAHFSVYAAVEKGGFKERGRELILDRGNNEGFLARLSLDGSRDLCTAEVQDSKGKWHQIVKPIPIYLRTTHCEIKMRGGPAKTQDVATESRGWFKNVRMYPRAVSHPILVHLVRRDGSPIYYRDKGGWPPKVRIAKHEPQTIEDLVVELWSADGKTRISRVQSPNLAHYMLPVKHENWTAFPVGALVRVSCGGKSLGEAKISVKNLEGLYPDDVYDVFVE